MLLATQRPKEAHMTTPTSATPLTITPANRVIRQGESATVWTQLTVTAPDAPADEQAKRTPLDIVIVLDRSGSMGHSNKLENARDAAAYVLSQLTSDDRACVIAYGSEVTVVHELSANHQQAIQAVQRIGLEGCTALAPALYQAIDQFEGNGRTRHVFLLSDGQANVGDTDPEIIASRIAPAVRQGVRVSTFGLGNDYNEVLMEAIAQAGGGGYHYLASADDAPAAFAAELDELMRVTMRETRLQLQPARGVKIIGLLGTEAKVGEPIVVGDIPAGSSRTVLAKLQVQAAGSASRKLVDVTITAKTGLDGKGSLDEKSTLTVTQSLDDSAVAAGVDADVLAMVAELEAAEAQRQAALAADRHDFDTARQLLGDARQRVEATLMMAPDSMLLMEKQSQLDVNLESVASAASYDSASAKHMRFSSYRSRASRR
jgi:Ca-activated chloride channel family protein